MFGGRVAFIRLRRHVLEGADNGPQEKAVDEPEDAGQAIQLVKVGNFHGGSQVGRDLAEQTE